MPLFRKMDRVSVLPLADLDEIMVKWDDWHLEDGSKSSVYRPIRGAKVFPLGMTALLRKAGFLQHSLEIRIPPMGFEPVLTA